MLMQKNILYPLIILGAGASFDSIHPDALKPEDRSPGLIFPLTDQLVEGQFADRELQSRYSEVKTLFARLISPTKGSSFEECLEGWNDYKQLSALRLYLGDYFWKKSQEEIIVKTPNNFLALVDYIKKSSVKGAHIVTFNYDVLLENALGIDRFFYLSDYIDGSVDNIHIIKIHGSCDWYHPMRRVASDIYSALSQHPEFFDRPNREILTKRWMEQPRSGADQLFPIPAISLPITSTKVYSCPPEHIRFLTSILPETQQLLIIGWKAGDLLFLEELKTIKRLANLIVVSGSEDGAKEVAEIVKAYVPSIRYTILFKGFSNFIGSKECNKFFSEL